MSRSFVVTGGGRGIGRTIVQRLLGHHNTVVAIDHDDAAFTWLDTHPARDRVLALVGDAANETLAAQAAQQAQAPGILSGWVNNAAVFRDLSLHDAAPRAVLDAITLNLNLALVGCATAVRQFLVSGIGGAIVNVSSHQAQRPVRGALPYATAKAAKA